MDSIHYISYGYIYIYGGEHIMKDIVRERFREICPNIEIKDMTRIQVEESCKVAFKIIGYFPQNFDTVFDETWGNHDLEYLYQFVYEVWRLDS